jgi:hypothetical protein
VMRALSKQPASRFPDVMAFTKAFQESVSGTAASPSAEPESSDSGGILSRVRGILRRS